MKKILLTILTTSVYIAAAAQFVAKMEVKEPISGVCNVKEIFVMLPGFKGQEEAVSPLSKEAILKKLNEEVTYLQDKPDYNDKGMIGLIINCSDNLVRSKIDNKTKNADLDAQIEAVFNSLGSWKSGKLNGKKVDTSKLYIFSIVNGKFTFD